MLDDHFEFIHLTIEDVSETFEPITDEFIDILSKHIKKNVKNDKIDCQALALTIFAFTYMSVLAKYKERTSFDLDKSLEGFINNITMCI